MSMKVPNFKEPGLSDFLARMIEERERNDAKNLSKVEANNSLLLHASDLSGKVYEIKVDGAGLLTATQVA